jgi:hypothetical protein
LPQCKALQTAALSFSPFHIPFPLSMSLLTKIKSNKKTLLWIVGVVVFGALAYMAYVYWRRNLQPKIYSATPVSAADEIAFNDIVDIIKNGGGGAASTAGLSALLNKAGDDFNGNTINPVWGNSKTGALMGAVDYFYYNPDARPGADNGKNIYKSNWMSETKYNQCRNRWQQYQQNPTA